MFTVINVKWIQITFQNSSKFKIQNFHSASWPQVSHYTPFIFNYQRFARLSLPKRMRRKKLGRKSSKQFILGFFLKLQLKRTKSVSCSLTYVVWDDDDDSIQFKNNFYTRLIWGHLSTSPESNDQFQFTAIAAYSFGCHKFYSSTWLLLLDWWASGEPLRSHFYWIWK